MMIEIRPIRPDEWHAAKRLIYTVARDVFHDPLPVDEMMATYDARGALDDMNDIQANYFENGGIFLVTTDQDRLIGTGAIRYSAERVCELKRLWLLTEYHGRGLGYQMMQELLAVAGARDQNGIAANRVERYVWDGANLSAPSLILDLPATRGPNHDGGVLLFGPDGMLYGVIGDLNRNGQLQNYPGGPSPDDTGIIFRLQHDGALPADNPFAALGGAMAKVFAYGVRNSFGMDFEPQTQVLWDSENGPDRFDELNRVPGGFNSGWEQIMGPDSQDPQGPGDLWNASGSQYADPLFSWFVPIGVTAGERVGIRRPLTVVSDGRFLTAGVLPRYQVVEELLFAWLLRNPCRAPPSRARRTSGCTARLLGTRMTHERH